MEEFDHKESTQSVNKKGFISVKPDEKEPTKTDEENGESQSLKNKYAEPIPKAVRALEEHSAFTGSMIALIGYILIAAWGRMTNYADFERYILFLVFIFIIYRALKVKLQGFVMKKKDWILLIICIVLFLVVVSDHFNEIINWFSNLLNTLKDNSAMPKDEINK